MCDRGSKDSSSKFYRKKETCKTKNFYTVLTFLLITIVLLITVSIYCYLIKHKAKQKPLLPYYITNDKLINLL